MKTSTHRLPVPRHRRVRRALLLGGALCVLGPAAADAQQGGDGSGQWMGLTGVYESGLDPASTRNAAFADWCGCPDNGQLLGHATWYSIAARFPTLLGERFGLATSFRYGSASAVFVGRHTVGDAGSDTLREYQEDSYAGLLQYDLMASAMIDPQVMISAGPWIAVPVSASSTRFWRRLEVGEKEDPGAGEPVASAIRDETFPLSWGAMVRWSVRVPVTPNVSLHPEVYVRIDGRRLGLGESFGSVMVGGGTSLFLDPAELFRAAAPLPSPPPPAPTPPPTIPPPPPSPPTASIAIYALDSDGARSEQATIHPRRERHLRQMPLPMSFGFVPMSEEFARPYRLDHRSPREGISIDSLAYLGVEEVALQGINIIGSRLRANRDGRIRLVAVTLGDEPIALGVARAQKIRTYLNERWGIEEQRIVIRTIVSKNPVVAEPVVMVVCGNEALASPVEAGWIEERFDAPRIALRPDMQAAAGVRRWRVDVYCGERIVSSCSSDSTAGTSPTIAFDLRGIDPGARLAPLVARLVVEDSLGVTTTASDDLGVAMDAQAATAPVGEQVRFILPASSITGARNGSARSIARSARKGARITLGACAPEGSRSRPSRHDIETFAEQIRRHVGRNDVTVTIDDSAPQALASYPGYDVEVKIDND